MKKFLSLVLALVMTMSLVTVSAGAQDFTDDSSITYEEAVDVTSAIGIIDGYTDGSFQPTTNLTRGAAAKIICNLILGPTTAAALGADTAPYSDVPTNHTFAGYIAYCQKEGIISGYADGTFRPAAPLTGYAFMKMLLGALGYDSDKEGYTGANWSVNVAKQALSIGLNDGNDDFVGQASVNREEAMLYAFNTLTARLVEYPNDSTITVGDVVVSTAGKATFVEYTNKVSDTGTIDGDGYVEFAEQYFPRLVLDPTRDSFQRPANNWSFKGDSIGTYTKTADAVYTANTTMADIYADVGLTSTSDDFNVYVDGVPANDYDPALSSLVTILKGNEDLKIGNGNGATVEVFKTGTPNVPGTIAITNNYAGEVIAVEPATTKSEAYIEVSTVGNLAAAYADNYATHDVLDNDVFKTTGYEVGDVVIFNYSLKDNKITSVSAAESVSGNVTSFTQDKKFTMGETTYEYSGRKTNVFGSADIATDVTVYLDGNGYAIYAKEGAENIKNYAFVVDAGKDSAIGGASFKAELLYTDGSTKLVETDEAYGTTNGASPAAGKNLKGQWVTFKTNSKGEVVLSNIGSTTVADVLASNPLVMTNGTSQIKDGATNVCKVSSDTLVIVKKGDNYKVYEGIKNMPTLTDSSNDAQIAYYTKAGATYAKLVYVDAGTASVTAGTNNTIFLVGDTNATVVETANDKYYVFDAVVDGKVVEDGVALDYTDASTASVIATLKTGAEVLLSSYAYDSATQLYTVNGGDTTNITSLSAANTIKKVSGNTIDFNGSSFVVADDCVFYRVDQYGNLKSSTIAGVRNGSIGDGYYTALSYIVNNDMEIVGVYWSYQ